MLIRTVTTVRMMKMMDAKRFVGLDEDLLGMGNEQNKTIQNLRGRDAEMERKRGWELDDPIISLWVGKRDVHVLCLPGSSF